MAQRISEQVVEWLSVGGNSFTPQQSVPLNVNYTGKTFGSLPAMGSSNVISIYNNQGAIWTLGAIAATTTPKSGQLIISSNDSQAGGAVAIELWRGSNSSWQIGNFNENFFIRTNRKTENALDTTYSLNVLQLETQTGDAYIWGNTTFYGRDAGASKGSNTPDAYGLNTLNVNGGVSIRGQLYLAHTGDASTAAATTTNAVAAHILGGLQTDKSIKIGKWTSTSAAPNAGIRIHDLRALDNDANRFGDQAVNWYFHQINGQWASIMHMKGWTGTYYAWELGGNASTAAQDRYYVRTLTGTTAGTWHTLAYIPAFAQIGSNTQPVYVDVNGKIIALTYTANRLYYSQDANNFVAGTYYADGTKLTINGTSAPANSGNFQVIGTSTMQHIYVQTTDTYDIGANTVRFRNIYGNGGYFGYSSKADGGVYLYTNSVTFGRFYLSTLGTTSVQGETILQLGNSNAAGAANNARGRIRIYGTSSTYQDVFPQPNGSQNVYLPNHNTAMYLTHTADNNAVGTATRPVYVAANGRITVGTYTLNATLNSGTANRLAYYSGTNAVSSAGSLYTTGANLGVNATTTTATPTGGSSTTFTMYVAGETHTTGVAHSNGGFYVHRAATGGGFYLYHNNSIVAQMYIAALGTASNGTTQGAQGDTYLILGNSIARAAATATTGANNARGILRLYGTSSTYQQIIPQSTAASQSIYLSAYNGVQYLAHTGDANAVGSATRPVYVAANGRITVGTYTLNATVNSGTTGYAAYYSGTNAVSSTSIARFDSSAAELTYNSRTIKPVLKIYGVTYHSSNVEAAGYFLQNVSAAGGGYYVYGNATQYGRLYIPTIGTTSANGRASLYLGNGTASGTANNAYGDILLYGTGTNYMLIRPSALTSNLTLGGTGGYFTMTGGLYVSGPIRTSQYGGTVPTAAPITGNGTFFFKI